MSAMSAKQAIEAVAAIGSELSAVGGAAFALGHVAGQADSTPEPLSRPLLIYWAGIASRAHYYQYVLGYNGLMDMVDQKGDAPWPGAPGWTEYPTSKVNQLPYMEDGAVKIGQSTAIVNYLAKKFGLDDVLSLADYAISQELIQQACDVHSMLGKAKYSADVVVAMDALFAEGGAVGKLLGAFEPHVNASGFFGTVATPGDLVFGAALNLLTRLAPECLDGFPKIKALNGLIQSNEGIQAVNAAAPGDYFTRK